MNWNLFRYFFNRRTLFAAMAVEVAGQIRLFPIGSLKIQPDGSASYFEMFARPIPDGASITVLGVDSSPLFWLWSLIRGHFSHPPAVRLTGTIGPRRPASAEEIAHFKKRVGWLLWTPGGKKLWSRPRDCRELRFETGHSLRLGAMTISMADWENSAVKTTEPKIVPAKPPEVMMM